jgi:4-hydroxybenzoate polyprenyltransferase
LPAAPGRGINAYLYQSLLRKLNKLSAYLRLMRMDRPIGAFLLLWPTLWALWIAGNGRPHAHIVVIFILGVFVMRAAGCVINDYADRNFDGAVARTKDRPLATGELSVKNAITAFAILISLAILLVYQLNTISRYIAIFAAVITMLYPFTKRVTYLPQFILGIAFSMGIPMAFAAELGVIPTVAWLLLIANLLWVISYDTIYALVDREDDLKIGIKSTAILFGRYTRVIIFIFALASLAVLGYIGQLTQFNGYFFSGLLLALINLIYQQWLIKDKNNTLQFRAFLSNNWFGAAVFTGLVLNYLA